MNKTLIKTITFSILCAGIYSCSHKATVPTRPNLITSTYLSGIDSLLMPSEINLSFFELEPVSFFVPTLEISENFNSLEKNEIRVKDTRLFEKRKELILDFGQLSDKDFAFPLPGAKVISDYGSRRGRAHTGIDLKTCANDTIVAAFDGIVRVANRGKGYGNVIVIRHYSGLETIYSHNAKNLVKSGDRVTAGTPIALTGRTGRATTEHLHFEARINGEHFNPNIIIDFKSRILQNKCLVITPGNKGNIQIDQI